MTPSLITSLLRTVESCCINCYITIHFATFTYNRRSSKAKKLNERGKSYVSWCFKRKIRKGFWHRILTEDKKTHYDKPKWLKCAQLPSKSIYTESYIHASKVMFCIRWNQVSKARISKARNNKFERSVPRKAPGIFQKTIWGCFPRCQCLGAILI